MHRRPASFLIRFTVLFSLIAGGVASSPRLLAEGMRDHAESLEAIPADASFYMAWVKNREQVDAMLQTNAWQKLMSIPVVQMGWMQAQTQWQFPTNPDIKAFKRWVDGPDGQKLVQLLTQMGSEEVFMYGDGSLATLADVLMEMNSAVSSAQFDELREAGDPDSMDQGDAIMRRMAELLKKHKDELNVPDLVMGFRVDDKELAVDMLDLLEAELPGLLVEAPVEVVELLSKLERTAGSGYDLLTLTITGDMIPWDQLEGDVDPDELEMFRMVKGVAEGKKAVLAIGVVENYVVISLGDSIDHLKQHGGSDLLADTKEFERLDQHASENIVSIAYASKPFMLAVGNNERSFGDMASMAKGALSLADWDPDRIKAIESDIDELMADIVEFLPEPGAFAAAGFTTDRGYESYGYNWGGMPPTVDATKPLPLINHLGEDSLGWFVARGKQSIGGYDKFVDWLQRGFAHFEAIAEEEADPADWAEYQAVREQALPLLQRLDKANREQLLPAMADGQGAIVFDASIADVEWCEFMSPADGELQMPNLALVYAVSDAAKLKAAASEYFDVAQEAIDAAHEAAPDEVAAFEVPQPLVSKSSVGTTYSYELPAEWGANERVAPNAALSDSVLVLSAFPELGEKLLAGSKPQVDGPAAEFDRPLMSAGHLKFAKFIDVLRPWMDYGIKVAMENDEEGTAVMMVGMVKPQVEQFLDVLQVFDSLTGVTYREDDAWVSHSEMRIIDLED